MNKETLYEILKPIEWLNFKNEKQLTTEIWHLLDANW